MSDQDFDEQLNKDYDQKRSNSLESNMLTPRQYFMVNLSKFLVEMMGTMMIGVFYILMGNEQTGILLGFWVVTLFAESISGAHFNPAITLVFMLRKNSNLGQRRLKGIIYMVGQLCGGILAGLLALMIQPGESIHPRPEIDSWEKDENGLATMPKYKFANIESYISEIVGSFVFIFLFMLATEKNSKFSEDKVINCFILAAAYVGARLMAGGMMVTCFAHIKKVQDEQTQAKSVEDDIEAQSTIGLVNVFRRMLQDKVAGAGADAPDDAAKAAEDANAASSPPTVNKDEEFLQQERIKNMHRVIEAGPLLNPAIGFGLLLTEFNFRLTTIQYLFCPFAGSILALIFYEQIYVKTQELLNEDETSSVGANDSGLGGLEGEIEPGENEEKNDGVQANDD